MKVKTFLSWVGFIAISIFVLFPFYWGIRTSLAPRFDSNWIPHKIVLTHYASILSQSQFFLYFKNSLIVALGTIIVVLPVSLLGGYALARFNFPGAKKLGSMILVFPMLPIIAILVPLMWYMNKLGLYNKLFSLIIVNSVVNIPFTVWMLRNFITGCPVEIEESALIDGCSRIGALLRITVPMMPPGLVAVVVFTFITTWNNYLYAAALIADPSLKVLPMAILGFIGTWGTYWGGLTAVGILVLIPPLILFLFFQKWFIAGLFGQWLK